MKAPLTIRMMKPKGPDEPHTYVTDPEESERLTAAARAVVFDPQVYERAASLIEGGFSQHYLALTADQKRSVPITSPDAACFCIIGAVCRAAYDLGHLKTDRDIETIWPSLVRPVTLALELPAGAPSWNNARGRTGEEVSQALHGARIERIEEEYTRD